MILEVRNWEKVELRRVVGLTVFGQVESELPKLGALVGEKAVERVVEHRRYQLPHDQTSLVSGRLGTVLATGTRLFPGRSAGVAAASVACRYCFRRHCRPEVIGAPSTGRLRRRPRALTWANVLSPEAGRLKRGRKS